ncbi:hypothetical protein MAR_017484 [Mya arenaria]|uniref:YqaJ viral recombinase domain-containing protein n=1 Tax=Mya arenaria TaxID=6604 RepID=A0ABY7EK02_MYAAR|nr:hypothetical protein MAR_017484 [Mya arenaria]
MPPTETNVKEETVNQSDTPEWFEQRNGRITASNFKRVCTRVDTLKQNEIKDAAKLVNSILGKDKPVKTKAMKHGIALEAFAKKEYKKIMKKTHKKFSSINTGLQISADKPFLAASVDLETSCKCCGEGLCEIKCPETIKDQKQPHENVKYIKENDGIGQMAISKRDHCDFFVFTYHGSLCIRVPFSAEFWATMEEKLPWFWMEHVLCNLMDGINGKENACIGEANVKQKAEKFTPFSKKDVSSNGNRTLEKNLKSTTTVCLFLQTSLFVEPCSWM